jgi:hypothetical protein
VSLSQPAIVQNTQSVIPPISLPAAPPIQAPAPAPAPPAPAVTQTPVPIAVVGAPQVAVPPIPPAVTPVPPGGAGAQAPSAARREEKARKHASQSAYVTRPGDASGIDWFYPALGLVSILAMLLAAEGLSGPRQRRALAELWEPGAPRPKRRRRL